MSGDGSSIGQQCQHAQDESSSSALTPPPPPPTPPSPPARRFWHATLALLMHACYLLSLIRLSNPCLCTHNCTRAANFPLQLQQGADVPLSSAANKQSAALLACILQRFAPTTSPTDWRIWFVDGSCPPGVSTISTLSDVEHWMSCITLSIDPRIASSLSLLLPSCVRRRT